MLAFTGRVTAHREIWDVAQRLIRHVDAGDPDEAARGFIDYWIAPGVIETMDERVRATISGVMPKVRDEWPIAFEAAGATLEELAALPMPIQLVAGSKTTCAAHGVVEVLRGIWPVAAYAEIAGAGHMSPLTHPERVNDVVEDFLHEHTRWTSA